MHPKASELPDQSIPIPKPALRCCNACFRRTPGLLTGMAISRVRAADWLAASAAASSSSAAGTTAPATSERSTRAGSKSKRNGASNLSRPRKNAQTRSQRHKSTRVLWAISDEARSYYLKAYKLHTHLLQEVDSTAHCFSASLRCWRTAAQIRQESSAQRQRSQRLGAHESAG